MALIGVLTALTALGAPAKEPLEICVERYSPLELAVTVGQVTDALSDDEVDEANARLGATLVALPCATEVVDARLLARFARIYAQSRFLAGDLTEARRWAGLSRSLADDLPWSYVFPEDDPFRQMVESVPLSGAQELDGRTLTVPAGGGVFANGALLRRPAAPADVPVLVQVFDDQQHLVDAWWQRGPRFPDAILSNAEAVPPPPPMWWKGDGPTSARYRPLNETAPQVYPSLRR